MHKLGLFLAFLAITLFGGFTATEQTASAVDTPTTCQFDPGILPGVEVAPAKAARAGSCSVTVVIDPVTRTILISAVLLADDFFVTDHQSVTTNFASIEEANAATCKQAWRLRFQYRNTGYAIAANVNCYSYALSVWGLSRN